MAGVFAVSRRGIGFPTENYKVGPEGVRRFSKPSVSAAHPPLQKSVKNCFENNNSFPAEREVSLIFSEKTVVVKTVGLTHILIDVLVEKMV
jgi:hypothetical protein